MVVPPDYRSPMPRQECPRKKNRRVTQEIEDSAQKIQKRLRKIEDTYKIPLEDIYTKAFFRCYPGLEEMATHRQSITVQHCIEVLDHGRVEGVSVAAGDKIPKHFYRTTQVAAWRAFRFYHHKGDHGQHLQKPGAVHKQYISQREMADMDHKMRYSLTDTYRDYLRVVADAVERTKRKEAQAAGRIRLGSFGLLSPFDLKKTFAQIRRTVLGPRKGHKLEIRLQDVGKVTKSISKEADKTIAKMQKETKKKQQKTADIKGEEEDAGSEKAGKEEEAGKEAEEELKEGREGTPDIQERRPGDA